MDPEIKNIHTYASDLADASRTDSVSVIKVALAEEKKNQQKETSKSASDTGLTKTLLVIGGIVLLVLGAGTYYFVFTKQQADTTPQIIPTAIETFVPYDSLDSIDVTNVGSYTDLTKAINAETSSPASPNKIKALILDRTTVTATTTNTAAITSKDFLALINSTMPDNLIRLLENDYMFGTYLPATTTDGKSHIFLMFEPKDYSTAYASMLTWESTMLSDLFPLFNINVAGDNRALLSTPWKDVIIANQDARVLYDQTGAPLLYYVFINKQYLVITDTPDIIKEIIARLIVKNTKPL